MRPSYPARTAAKGLYTFHRGAAANAAVAYMVVIMENGEVEDEHLIELQTILEKIVPAHIPLTVRLPKQDGKITAHLSAAVTSLGGSMSVTAVRPTHMDVSTTAYPMAAITKIQSSINVTARNNS